MLHKFLRSKMLHKFLRRKMIRDNIKSEILNPKSQKEQSKDLKRRIRDFQQITEAQLIYQ